MAEWILTDKDIGMDGAYYDYPELIRCKDCKHWYKGLNINYCRIFYDDNLKLYKSRADDYCSSAERKQDDA